MYFALDSKGLSEPRFVTNIAASIITYTILEGSEDVPAAER